MQSRVFTLPNIISVFRLVLLIVALFLFGSDNTVDASFVIAVFLFTFACMSDYLDGYLARKLNQVTALGKILDPSIDRVVFIFGTYKLLQLGLMPESVAVFILTRELVIVFLAIVYMSKVQVELEVSRLGKWGAFGIFVYLPGLTQAHVLDFSPYSVFINLFGVFGVMLSAVSFFMYIIKYVIKFKLRTRG